MTGWVIETLVASSLLMLLVLALRRPVRDRFGAPLAYWLWALPVLRMLLPPLPGQWRFSAWLSPLVHRSEGHEVAMGLLATRSAPQPILDHAIMTIPLGHAADAGGVALVPPVAVSGGAPIAALLIGLWLLGAMLFLGWHLLSYRRFCRDIVAGARDSRMVAQGRIRVVESATAAGPLAFGMWRRYVAFPADFSARYDRTERDLALAHELAHHARGDLHANWVALVMLSLHWFNPIAWRAFRAFRADQEMACDAQVLAGRPTSLRHAYGRAIVKSASGGAISAACHLNTVRDLKGRLKMLSKLNTSSLAVRRAGAAGLAVIAAAGLMLTASQSSAEAPKDAISAPTPPTPPAAQPAPPVHPAPPVAQAAAAPEAPPAPPARGQIAPVPVPPSVPEAPQPDGNRTVEVRRISDGDRAKINIEVRRANEVAAHALANAPEVTDGKCGAGTEMVRSSTMANGKVHMVICTDRIERMTRDVTVRAMSQQRMALASAESGLRAARQSIEANSKMSAEERSAALAGIDQAMAEIRKERDSKD